MSDPLYRKELLRLAADAHGAGRLPEPRVTGHAHNPACGDKVSVDLALVEGRIAAIALDTKACVLTQASASLLGRGLKGMSRAEVEKLRDAVKAMLESRGTAPVPPFTDFAAFDGAAPFSGRHTCVLLPFDAVLAAFETKE